MAAKQINTPTKMLNKKTLSIIFMDNPEHQIRGVCVCVCAHARARACVWRERDRRHFALKYAPGFVNMFTESKVSMVSAASLFWLIGEQNCILEYSWRICVSLGSSVVHNSFANNRYEI